MFYLFSSGGACRRNPAAGDSLSEDGSCECLFIRLSDWYAPQAYFSDAGKVGKSALGRPQPPFVCPIGRLPGRYPVATEFPLGRWPLVIGAVVYPLRLTALGLRGVSFWEAGTKAGPRDVCSSSVKSRWIYPFKRATAEAGRAARCRSAPRRTRCLSGTPSSSSIQTDWTKRGSSPKGAGAFSVHFCAYKSEPAGGKPTKAIPSET